MKPSEQDRVLGSILADENVERVRASSLAGILAVSAQRRRRRAIFSGAAAAAVLLMAAFVLSPRAARPTPAITNAAPVPERSRVKSITDDQLLALFPGRNVALVGARGAQRLMFLDEGKEAANSTP